MKQLIKATTTPLASIFGSGFLVIVPILCGAVGPEDRHPAATNVPPAITAADGRRPATGDK